MFGVYFDNQTLKRSLELFEFIFKDIQIERSNGTRTQKQTVPIQFASGEKYIEQKESDPSMLKSVAVQLPRMSYNMVGFTRDASRQLNPQNKLVNPSTGDTRYVPVPYNLTFELYISARNTEDAFKIVSQIVPYFTPFFGIQVALLDGQPSFPIILNLETSGKSDQYEGVIDDKRDLQWIMVFTMKTWMFGMNLNTGSNGHVIRWVSVYESAVNAVSNVASIAAFDTNSNTYVYIEGVDIHNIQANDDYIVKTEKIDNIG